MGFNPAFKGLIFKFLDSKLEGNLKTYWEVEISSTHSLRH